MRTVQQYEIGVDLSERSFEEFVHRLGAIADIARVTIICGDRWWADAERIRQKYKCQVWPVPHEMLQNEFTWGVLWNGSTVWSKGTC